MHPTMPMDHRARLARLAAATLTLALAAASTSPAAGGSLPARPPSPPGGNQPPSVPVPVAPSDEGGVATTTPVFSWQRATDPEGDDILYELEVTDADGALFAALGVRATVASLTQELENRGTYGWRVRAIDSLGAASEFSPTSTFQVAAPVDDPEVTVDGGGCDASRAPGAGGLALALGVLALGARPRRRRFRS